MGRGEAFRTQNWRPAPVERRLLNQQLACKSHGEYLLKGLSNAGLTIHIYLHAWLREDWMKLHIPMLKNAYEPWGALVSTFQDRKPTSQGHGTKDAVGFLREQTKSRTAADLPYDFVMLLRLDLVLTSLAVPPPSFAARVLWPMRDCPNCWKGEGIVHDTMIWIPQRYFRRFFDEILGRAGCFEKSKNPRAGSGHLFWPALLEKQPHVEQGFWHDGCFGVRVA